MINTQQLNGSEWAHTLIANGKAKLVVKSKLEQNCTCVSRVYEVRRSFERVENARQFNMIEDAIEAYNAIK